MSESPDTARRRLRTGNRDVYIPSRLTFKPDPPFNFIRDLRHKQRLWNREGPAMPVTKADLDKRFDHHPPSNNDVANTHEIMREAFKELASHVVAWVPEGREQSLALTALEEGLMWSNAGIARHQ